MVLKLCDLFGIEPIPLSKPKPVKRYDGKIADKRITHMLLPRFTIQGHQESTCPMLITKLGQHKVILGTPWMKKHGVFLDMVNDKLIFMPNHCDHQGAIIDVPKKIQLNEDIGLPVTPCNVPML